MFSARYLHTPVDVSVSTELCVIEFLVGGEDAGVTKQEIMEALIMATSSSGHLEICFSLLERKLKRTSYDWTSALKVLLLLHYLYRDDVLRAKMLGKEFLVENFLSHISERCDCAFVQNYAVYLINLQKMGCPPSCKSASEFMDAYSTLTHTIELLLNCHMPMDLDVNRCGFVEASMEHLLQDSYVCYNSLRVGMDLLSDAVFDIEFHAYEKAVGMHAEALTCVMKLTQFFAHAFDMLGERDTRPHSMLSQSVGFANVRETSNAVLLLPSTSGGNVATGGDTLEARSNDNLHKPMSVADLKELFSAHEKSLMANMNQGFTETKDLFAGFTKQMASFKHMLQADNGPHDVKRYEQSMKDMEKKLRSLIDAHASKVHKKLDKLDRRVGAFHEKLCRALLGRNMAMLVRKCNVLEGFREQDARMSYRFTCIRDICDHLKLRPSECRHVKDSLVNDLMADQVGKNVVVSFLAILVHELEKRFSPDREKWPKFALKVQKHCEDVSGLLSKPFAIPEVVEKLKNIKELGKANSKLEEDNVWRLCEHVDALIVLIHVSEGPTSTRVDNVMTEQWGLLVLFWVLKRAFRHAEVEVELRGSVARDWTCWVICIGEIKSSDGIAMDKARKQMAFVHEVFEHILKRVAFPKDIEYECKVTKCIFTVHSTQGKVVPLTDIDGDFVTVDVSQLPY